jgi:TolB-like protein/Tfp pilus assembly protein PilF
MLRRSGAMVGVIGMDGSRDIDSGGPVLAVLPFATLGASGDDALLAQGLHEDVCAELTRFRALRVVSWMSAVAATDLSDAEVGAKLGATHVLRGRLRRAEGRLQLSASLSTCADSTQIWSERITVPADDVFALQDEVVGRIAAMLNARLEESALSEARRRPTGSLAAYALTLRGLTLLRQATAAADQEARELFQRAIELDPHYARAHGGVALSYFNEWSCAFWDRFYENARLAYAHAHRALDLDDRDAMLHLVIAKVQLFRREYEQASWYLDRALALCPNDADLLIQIANAETFLGRPEVGIAHAAKAMRLNPYHPNIYYIYAAIAHLHAGDIDAALAFGMRNDGLPFVDAPAFLAIACAHAGRMEEGLRALAEYHAAFRKRIAFGREPAPGEPARWMLEINPYRRAQDLALLREGFRLLGEPIGAPEPVLLPVLGDAPDLPEPAAAEPLLARAGEGWVADYDGRRAVLPDLKGLADIRRLLERPGEEIHCLDLAGREDDAFRGEAVLDDAARQALKGRIRDLQEELAEAEDMNDPGRAERARAELDRLIETLSKALGLGGRGRRLGDAAERARTTVTWRIRHAVRRIEATHPELGRHFANSLRTGTFCVYQPERMLRWRLDDIAAVV